MPSFEGGKAGRPEREWASQFESEKSKEDRWKDAELILNKVRDELNAQPSMIPLDDYAEYLQSAKDYKEIQETNPGDVNKKLAIIADQIIEQAPRELKE